MDWKLGDTNDLKEWIEKLAGASDERKTEIPDLRNEIYNMKLSFEAIQKKLDNIERILERVAE